MSLPGLTARREKKRNETRTFAGIRPLDPFKGSRGDFPRFDLI
jgi:hypothetical protein